MSVFRYMYMILTLCFVLFDKCLALLGARSTAKVRSSSTQLCSHHGNGHPAILCVSKRGCPATCAQHRVGQALVVVLVWSCHTVPTS
jgi:hypothetical protein